MFIELTNIRNDELRWSEILNSRKLRIFFYYGQPRCLCLKRIESRAFNRLRPPNITDPDVYRKYIAAQAAYQKNTAEGNYKSEQLYKEALELEPENSRLKYFLGWVHWQRMTLGLSTDPKADFEIAYKYSYEAMEKKPKWASPQAQESVLEGIMGKHDIACARLPKCVLWREL